MSNEWKPLSAACLIILCIGLAYGLALSPRDPMLPYKVVLSGPTSPDHYSSIFGSDPFMDIIVLVQALVAGGTGVLIYRQVDTSRVQLRAYIFVSSAGVTGSISDDVLEATVHIKNFGQTPASKVVNVSGIAIDRFPPPSALKLEITDDIFAKHGRTLQSIGPSGEATAITSAGRRLYSEEVQDIREGKGAIYVYGETRYEDAFGRKRRSRYRYMMGGPVGILPSGRLAACAEGNDAT